MAHPLQASVCHLFASLSFDRCCLPSPTPQQVLSSLTPSPSASGPMAVSGCQHVNTVSNMSMAATLSGHGGADACFPLYVNVTSHKSAHALEMDSCFLLNDAMSPGDVLDGQILLPVDVTVIEGIVNHGDAEDMTAYTSQYGGDADHQVMINSLESLNLSLDFFNLRVENNFTVHLLSPCTSRLSRSFTSILNINLTYFPYSSSLRLLSFNNSSFLSSSCLSPPLKFLLSKFSFSTSVQQLLVPFSPQISDFSVPFLCHFSSHPHDSKSTIVPPLHLEDSFFKLPITFSSSMVYSFLPIPSHLQVNFECLSSTL